MLKLILPRTSGSTAIPGHVTTLSVSWLNSQFKALAVHRGVVEGTWDHTGPVEGVEQFEALIREAIQQTGYHGQTVSLLVAHPRLAQQLVDAPPAKAPISASSACRLQWRCPTNGSIRASAPRLSVRARSRSAPRP